jgi:ribosome-binding ATPase YchF (GTP1/OBG family)
MADLENNENYKILLKLAQAEGAKVLPICAKLEQDLAELTRRSVRRFWRIWVLEKWA